MISIVAVSPAGSGGTYVDINGYAAKQFASQRSLVCLTCLNLATWKFPQAGEHGRRASLGNEILPVTLNQRSYDTNVRHDSDSVRCWHCQPSARRCTVKPRL